MKMRRYARYKASPSEWLGDIPTHWTAEPLKRLSSIELSNVDKHTVEGEHRVRLCNYTDVYKNERIVGSLPFMQASASDEQIRRLTLRRGDVIVTKDSETPDDIGVPAIVADDLDNVVCGYHLALIRPRSSKATGRFLQRMFEGTYVRSEFASRAVGMTRFALGRYEISNLLLPVPPLAEQRLISAFLDRETAKLDTLIAKQERLIELLQEKRQAVISHAVTKGLNANVPMKDSGMEWLGEVPAHWDVKRLRFATTSINAGPFGSSLTKDMYVDSGYRVYGQEQVIPDDFSVGDYYISNTKFQQLQQYAVHPGDVLVSCVGTFGKIAVVPEQVEPGIINPRLIRLRCKPKIVPTYLAEALRSRPTFEQLSVRSRGGTMDVINVEILSEIVVPCPPEEEQERIMDAVKVASRKLELLIENASASIGLMREHRSALISAAVTGKIDVRDEAAVAATEQLVTA